jgi:hypothetical protein
MRSAHLVEKKMENEENATKDAPSEPLRDDLLWGIREIAKEIGRSERQTFHLASTGQIPVGKIGGRHVASRSKLRARFATAVLGEIG